MCTRMDFQTFIRDHLQKFRQNKYEVKITFKKPEVIHE